MQVQSEVVLDMLLAIACSSVPQMFRPDVSDVLPKWLLAIPLVFGLFGAVFSGWLADAKLGNTVLFCYSSFVCFLVPAP